MATRTQPKQRAIAAVIAVIAIAFVIGWLIRKDDTLKVPLGVEQAAIVTFGGPELMVAPYKWGVAVNVRIAQVTEQTGRRIYDVRYFVNRAGTFDLKDYLTATDGSPLTGLPSFKFQGDATLSKNLDTRIRETEEVRIDVGGHYDRNLTLLFVLWIGWLLLLIFYKRPRGTAETDSGPAAPALAEILRSLHAQLQAGTLNAAGKARMEMLLLQCWRDHLALGPVPMRVVMQAIGNDGTMGAHLRKLEHWMHHPASTVPPGEIAAIVESLAAKAEPCVTFAKYAGK